MSELETLAEEWEREAAKKNCKFTISHTLQDCANQLRSLLSRCLVLEPVDLEGEIAEGEYVVQYSSGRQVHDSRTLRWNINPETRFRKPVRAYGPLPEGEVMSDHDEGFL